MTTHALSDQTNDLPQHADWYGRWRARIHGWVSRYSHSMLASVVLLLPDFIMLLVGLLRDSRIPVWTKVKVAAVLLYVMSPIDILPEVALGFFGLAEDTGLTLALLMSLQNSAGLDNAILREHWRGPGDIIDVIGKAVQLYTRWRRRFSPVARIRGWFRKDKNRV